MRSEGSRDAERAEALHRLREELQRNYGSWCPCIPTESIQCCGNWIEFSVRSEGCRDFEKAVGLLRLRGGAAPTSLSLVTIKLHWFPKTCENHVFRIEGPLQWGGWGYVRDHSPNTITTKQHPLHLSTDFYKKLSFASMLVAAGYPVRLERSQIRPTIATLPDMCRSTVLSYPINYYEWGIAVSAGSVGNKS